jgi:hypothetical protein
MSQPPLNNSGARYWNDLVEEFDFSPDEKREIREGATSATNPTFSADQTTGILA